MIKNSKIFVRKFSQLKKYFEVLELEQNATPEQIKQRYKQLTKQYHPDVNQKNSQKFLDINEAYSILKENNFKSEKVKVTNNHKEYTFGEQLKNFQNSKKIQYTDEYDNKFEYEKRFAKIDHQNVKDQKIFEETSKKVYNNFDYVKEDFKNTYVIPIMFIVLLIFMTYSINHQKEILKKDFADIKKKESLRTFQEKKREYQFL